MKNKESQIMRAVCFVFLIGVIVCCFLFPSVLRWYFSFRHISMEFYPALLIVAYGCALMAVAALLFLLRLLSNICVGQVFVSRNIRLIDLLSSCCIGVVILTVYGCFFYLPLVFLAIAAGFMALIIRVIRSVFASAVAIKDENDMTI